MYTYAGDNRCKLGTALGPCSRSCEQRATEIERERCGQTQFGRIVHEIYMANPACT